MSRYLSCLILVSALLLSPAKSTATLIKLSDSSGHVIYDNVAQQYWYWDLNAFVNQNYSQQLSSIEQLNAASYFGISTWHLASFREIWWLVDTNIFAELLMFKPSYVRPTTSTGETYAFWSGRVDDQQPSNNRLSIEYRRDITQQISQDMYDLKFTHIAWDWYGMYPLDDVAYSSIGAWIASDQNYSVPEPSSMLLLASGVVALVIMRRRNNNRRNSPNVPLSQ